MKINQIEQLDHISATQPIIYIENIYININDLVKLCFWDLRNCGQLFQRECQRITAKIMNSMPIKRTVPSGSKLRLLSLYLIINIMLKFYVRKLPLSFNYKLAILRIYKVLNIFKDIIEIMLERICSITIFVLQKCCTKSNGSKQNWKLLNN